MVKIHPLMRSRDIHQLEIGCFPLLIEVLYLIRTQKNIRICQDLVLMICSQILGLYKIWTAQKLSEIRPEDRLHQELIDIESNMNLFFY